MSVLKDIQIRELKIPFKTIFRHHSATRQFTQAVLVIATDGTLKGYGEGCPREYVTHESVASCLQFFNLFKAEIIDRINDLVSLKAFKIRNDDDIRNNHAAWCAIELALLDLFAKQQKCSIEKYLGLAELNGSFSYSAVIGDETEKDFKDNAQKYIDLQMHDFKIKVSADPEIDYKKLDALKKMDPQCIIRVDANNLWKDKDEVKIYLSKLGVVINGIEEPLESKDIDALKLLAQEISLPIILDESFCDISGLKKIQGKEQLFIVNLRVSKLGGLLNTLEIAEECKREGIKVIIGAQVGETSILTRAALTVANSSGSNYQAMEGAFGTMLLERDVVDSPLMFGTRGILRPEEHLNQEENGFQLKINYTGNEDLPTR